MKNISVYSLVSTFLLFARVLYAETSTTRDPVEIRTGKSFLGRIGDLFNAEAGRIYSANWLEIRYRPFFSIPRWQGIGVQLGAHQTDDKTKGTACRIAPALAGKHYCSDVDFELDRGAQFTAIFAGLQTELVELIQREAKPIRVFVGGGGTYLRSTFFSSRTRPYFSLEMNSEIEDRFQASAGIFLSLTHEKETFGAAVPEVTLQYRF